jgi:ABC-type uncharacterized transport system permease subunit
MWRIVQSPFGLHLKTIRDNARKAEYLGVHVHRCRLAAFIISAAYGAVGGAILGAILGGAKGALAGILIGAGGTVAATEGKDVELPAGTVLRVRLDSALNLQR